MDMGNKDIIPNQLALVLGLAPESEKGGRLGHYLDIIGGTPAIFEALPNIKKENLIVIVPFKSEYFNDDWKTRLGKVKLFLTENGISCHYVKNGSKDAIAIDASAGDNAKKIEELYEASEKAFAEKNRVRREDRSIGR